MINYFRLKHAEEIKRKMRRLLLKRGVRAILAIALSLSWTLASWPTDVFAVQFGRPDSNITQTNFTGGFAEIDEATASDADFAYGANNTVAVLEVGLSNVTDPESSSGHTFRYRIAKTNNGTVDGGGSALTVTAGLYQGTTLIAADTAKTADGTWTQYSFTLSDAQTDAITDYTDLRLRFTTSASGGSPANRRGGAVSWAEFETPDLAPPPDFSLTSPDIVFSNPTPIEGSNVTITATIHNNGGSYTAFVGSTNYAAQSNGAAAATADSQQAPTFVSANANDGSISTGWASNFVTGWVQVDMQTARNIKKVAWDDTAFVSANQPGSFTISLSTNGTDWTAVASESGYAGSTYTKTLGYAVNARYIKMDVTARVAGNAATLGELQAYAGTSAIAVDFYDGDPDAGGLKIGATQFIDSIAGAATAEAQVTWTAVVGSHNIYVKIDGAAAITESNETNNKAFKNIYVYVPPTVVLNTADLTDFGTDTTPTLEFTGTADLANDIRYNAQISNSADFSGWYNANWLFRVKITVDNTKVNADLTNFPVYVDLANLPAGFHTNVNQTDARDIRVTSSDGTTELPREVVSYNSATDTGELHFKAGSLANATNTDFYIYYGNAGATEPLATDTYGRNNVWDSNFKTVQHLKDTTTSSVTDSTVNANNGTKLAANEPIQGTGKIGNGQTFDGSNDNINHGNGASFSITSAITVEAWINTNSLSSRQVISAKTASGDNTWLVEINPLDCPSGTPYFFSSGLSDTDLCSTSAVTASSWHHVAFTYSGSTKVIYINGSAAGTENATGSIATNTQPVRIGDWGSTGRPFNGSIDEVRISNSARSSGWIATEYNNQNSPSTFYSVGTQRGSFVLLLLDKTSGTDAGFLNTVTGGDLDPFNSGEKVSYTVQTADALATGTYYWRVRGIDPAGSNTYGAFSATRSFTVNTGAAPGPTTDQVMRHGNWFDAGVEQGFFWAD